MAKDPAFLFYPSDFLTGTMFMTNEQIGIYIRLLCSQHQHGGIIDKDSFNALVGNNLLIKNKFVETETGFYNERLTIEMDKRNKKSNNMSDTAKEVWKKRKEQKQCKSKENEYKSNTNVKENDTNVIQTVDVNRNINRDYIDKEFLEIFNKWMQYKSERKEKYKSELSEKSFYNSLIKLSNNNKLIAEQIIEQSIANNWAGIFELKKPLFNNNQDIYKPKKPARTF